MSNIFNISINDNIVEYTTKHILKIYPNSIDFSDIAIVMPSKRASLFIKKELSKHLKTSFISPKFFTIDNLVLEIDKKYCKKKLISSIDSAYMIYKITKNNIKDYEFSKSTFSEFFGWSYEILNFINSLDVEKIDNLKLLNLKLNADIGYDLPKNINNLLKILYLIREEFHKQLDLLNKTTSGYSYYNASENVCKYLKKYKKVILFNPYYLNKSEVDLFTQIYDKKDLDIILKGNSNNWVALKKIYTDFNCVNNTKIQDVFNDNVDIYTAYDGQTQACLVKNLISNLSQEERKNTVVIVPDNSILQSVMSELYSIEKDINIAVGYPAKKTTVFSLINSLIQIQKNKNDKGYYVKDIVSVLSNPLVKNMRFIGKPEVTRIIVHEIIKNFDRFNKDALFKGYMFISLEEIFDNKILCQNISTQITSYWQKVTSIRVKKIIKEIFSLFIINFSKTNNIQNFGENIKSVADSIVDKSLINTYQFNFGAINILYDISSQFINSICSKENFSIKEILNIFENMLINKNISLVGSPLKGLQVLGLMESRGLTFDNVFILSMTDSIVPKVSEISPLIPKDISNFLGIGYSGRDVDIQKYHFMSLISKAKKVSLIYPKNDNSVKSRFIEELIWRKQFKEKNLEVTNINDAIIAHSNLQRTKSEYKKTDKIKQYLSKFRYSATSIDTYMQCELKFYYKYILRLKEQVDYDKDYESVEIGICIHNFLRQIFHKGFCYSTLLNSNFKINYQKKLDEYLNNYFKNKQIGKNFLLKKLIKFKLENFYENEIKRKFSEILDVEFDVISTISIDGKKYILNSRIDRLDINEDKKLTLIDYKTGKVEAPLYKKNFIDTNNFTREIVLKNIKSFQLIIYKYLYENKFEKEIDNCVLYSIKNFKFEKLFDEKQDKKMLYNSTIRQLKYIISDINSDKPFKSELYDNVKCETCPYFYLCR